MASTKQTLDELLSDFSQRLDDLYENNDEVFQSMVMSEFVQSLDSVALGKPEPLAKNKQCDDNFICYLFESGRCSAKCHKPCGDIGCLAV